MNHTESNQQKVVAIIPARYHSTRLHAKVLLPIKNRPMVLYVIERALCAKHVSRVIVATDDERILDVVVSAGYEAMMTSPHHRSGSDRLAEVAKTLDDADVIVNVQGDEPLISPRTIDAVIEALLKDNEAVISTTCEEIRDIKDALSADVVKVVTDQNKRALYFSRQPIPFPRDAVKEHGSLERALAADSSLLKTFRKHTGLYVYRKDFLLEYSSWEQSHLEKLESLEQLRALEHGAKIVVVEVDEPSIGVDTKEDYERVKAIIENE